MLNKRTLAMITAATVALTACASNSSKEPEAVKARQDMMHDWKAAGEAMKGMMEKPESFDAKTFQERANAIANSTDQMWAHFEGEANKGGKSKDEIWKNAAEWTEEKAEFDEKAKALAAAAQTATTSEDVKAQFGAMMETCGTCHKEFRQ